MYPDRKKLYIISSATLVALLIALLVPSDSGRMLAALLLLPAVIITVFFIKKRLARSIYSNAVLMIVGTVALLYVVLYYLSGLYFGFVKTPYIFNQDIFFRFILPIAIIIVSTEIIRYVLCVQKNTFTLILAYLIGVLADILIESNISDITTFSAFMSVIGLTLLPSLLYNLLYNYLCARYGFMPSLVYRMITVWVFYLIPYGSAVSDAIVSLANMLIPIGIYYFIYSLYGKKQQKAIKEGILFSRILSKLVTAAAVIIMLCAVMLVSNQFSWGTLVIATPSMSGEINQGDAVIYKEYENDRSIEVGQILVFEKDNSTIVHRVVDIEIINGQERYITKGDANEDEDLGYITDANIVGVVEAKVSLIGYPTLWLRGLFKK